MAPKTVVLASGLVQSGPARRKLSDPQLRQRQGPRSAVKGTGAPSAQELQCAYRWTFSTSDGLSGVCRDTRSIVRKTGPWGL
eukprot:scaffold7328_cov314-Pinguiococcus_pyrenoidosus.AAC.72